jgi:hypothetical protein
MSGGIRSWIAILKRTVRLSFILLLVLIPCLPQIDVRGVTGIVTDKRGNTLGGAAVQLENTATLSIMSYITSKDGHYNFNGLYNDVDYTLKAKYRNRWSERKTLSKFNSSKHPEVNLVIPTE